MCFCAGGARGFDTLASEAVLSLKERYPEIKLVLVLPFKDHYKEETWTNEEIGRFINLKNNADNILYVKNNYEKGYYYERNRKMVDFSSVCVCYKSRKTGGTAYTVEYAEGKGLRIINLI